MVAVEVNVCKGSLNKKPLITRVYSSSCVGEELLLAQTAITGQTTAVAGLLYVHCAVDCVIKYVFKFIA